MGCASGRHGFFALAPAVAAVALLAGCASLPPPDDDQQSLLVFYWQSEAEVPGAALPSGDTLSIEGPVTRQVEFAEQPWGYHVVPLPPGDYRLVRRVTRWRDGQTVDGVPAGASEVVLGAAEVQLVPLAFYRTNAERARAGADAGAIDPQQTRRVSDALRDRASFSRWAGRTAYGFEPFSPFEEYTESRYRVEIASRPAGARVLINDQEWGSSPLTVTLPAGKHFISLYSDGYEPEHGYLNVSSDGASGYQLTPARSAAHAGDGTERAVLMPFVNVGGPEDAYLRSVFFDSLQLTLEAEGLEVVPYREDVPTAAAPDFAFAEAVGARLLISGDFLSSGEEVLVHAALYDVRSELVKAGLLFNRPAGFEIFDSVDSISREFGVAVSRVLPEIGQQVVVERHLTGEGRAFSERLAERGVVQRRMEYPRALDVGLVYGAFQDRVSFDGADSIRLDEAGPSFGANVSYDHPLSEALSGVVQLGAFYTASHRDGDGGGSWHIPLHAGPRVTFRGYKNDIYVGVLGAWHFATRREVFGRDEQTDDETSAEVGPYWFTTLNLETGLRVYLGDDLSRRPSFLTFGLMLGVGGYRFEIDFSDVDPAEFEVWLRGGIGVRL
ncbi:MAG: PEGA domain-containing protein [Spirochaetaceae bacterium]|nr:MAG: PEGA domain-containing protein [Spirochaetaceae bacterium]